MGGHDNGLAPLHQALEELKNRLGGRGIQAAGGLVGDDNRRVGGQGAGDRHALLLSAGDVGRQLAGVFFQLHQAQQLQGALAAGPAAIAAAKIHRQNDIVHQGEHRQELEGLVDHPKVAATPARALVLTDLMDVDPLGEHFAGGQPIDAGDHIQQSGFARPRFSDHAQKFAAVDIQVNPVQRPEIPGRAAVNLDHLTQLNLRRSRF